MLFLLHFFCMYIQFQYITIKLKLMSIIFLLSNDNTDIKKMSKTPNLVDLLFKAFGAFRSNSFLSS